MTIALLISTYNWPKALELVLDSVLLQTRLPDEILIADDGSKVETMEVIEKFRKETAIPVNHVWHEDKGFQLAQIRNKAIVKSTCDYIIQIDGDIILDKYFIMDHERLIAKNKFIVGSRNLLSEKDTIKMLKNEDTIGKIRRKYRTHLNNLRSTVLSKLMSQRYKTKGKHTYYAKGCNMSFWRESIIAVNGYNEDMTGWGYEDSELVARLIKLGEKKLFLKFGGITYHLWHKVSSMERKNINLSILEATIASSEYKTKNGLDKYL